MLFTETKLKGAYIIETEKIHDERGYFARAYCQREFGMHGLTSLFVQANVSCNRQQSTLRGLHFQVPPFQEVKLVRCTKGAIYDVIVDLRRDSASFLQWLAVELTERNGLMLLVPEGFAHGYQTLEKDTEVFYMVSQFYSRDHERGIRWNDERINVQWPPAVGALVISDKDRQWPDYSMEAFRW